ncbi:MAG: hypothetical protein JSV20_06565 [Candidatus Bathyarchaeota archaeon]|nr:MAG: hypothetical protein JSV20_06565 [Candidatus Bathyarchaeota archaeon]
MKSGITGNELTTIELAGQGDILYERGTGVLKPVDQHFKYVVVWNKTKDGWKYQWDIWNSRAR